MFTTILSVSLSFLAGFLLGDLNRKMQWKLLPWKILKWHEGSWGYRIVATNASISRNEKAYLALPIDTSEIKPGEPLKLFEE